MTQFARGPLNSMLKSILRHCLQNPLPENLRLVEWAERNSRSNWRSVSREVGSEAMFDRRLYQGIPRKRWSKQDPRVPPDQEPLLARSLIPIQVTLEGETLALSWWTWLAELRRSWRCLSVVPFSYKVTWAKERLLLARSVTFLCLSTLSNFERKLLPG